jgi:hypothetical protein
VRHPFDAYGRRQGPPRLALAVVIACAIAAGMLTGAGISRLLIHDAPSAPAATGPNVPVVADHTPEGAARAAGSYLAMLGGPLALDPVGDQAALDRIAEPAAREQLRSGLAASLQADESLWGIRAAAQQGKHVVLAQTPIAYRVDSYRDGVATVAMWLVIDVGVQDHQRLTALFANAGATVVWLDGGWRLREIENGGAAGDVIPACLQTPTPTGGVPSALDGFTPYA